MYGIIYMIMMNQEERIEMRVIYVHTGANIVNGMLII